jgi:hypothetical protein
MLNSQPKHRDDLEIKGVPNSQVAIAGNVFVKYMKFTQKGQKMEGHMHVYDHVTLLASGTVRAFCEGIEVEFEAPHLIVTRANKLHSFVSLTDEALIACVHALRDDDGEILPPDSDLMEASKTVINLTHPVLNN